MKYLGAPLAWIVAIVMAFLFLGQCRKGEPAIPPELRARADSLAGTKAERDSARAREMRTADSNQALASALRRRATPARAVATATGVTADSAATLAQQAATARDSAALWQTAYRARTEQADSLASVVAILDSAAVNDSLAINALRIGWAADSTRLLVAEKLVRDLVEAAEKKARWAFLKRLNVTVGPTVVATADGRFAYGVGVTAGVKIYP